MADDYISIAGHACELLDDDKVIEKAGAFNTIVYKIAEQFKDSRNQMKEIEDYPNRQYKR